MQVPTTLYQSGPVAARSNYARCASRAKPALESAQVLLGIALALALSAPGCKREAPVSSTRAVASAPRAAASAPPIPALVSRCRVVEGDGTRFSLGSASGAPKGDEDDDAVALPFSPEVGNAVPFGAGFVVGALEPKGKSTSAVLIVTSRNLPVGKKIDLGAVHGDVLAPRVAARGKSLVVAAPDGAPNGTLVRLALVDDASGNPAVRFGADVPFGRDESDAFSLEVGDKVGILAWDEWNSHGEHGEIRAVTFAPGDVSKTSAPLVMTGSHEDAESPSLAVRPGGFWAAWIVNVKREPDEKARGGASEGDTPVDLGPRYVVVAPLDEYGKPSGTPLTVSAKDGHVTGFDLGTLRDGALAVASRDDPPGPSTGSTTHLVLVHPDGSIDPRNVGDEEATVGVPSLVVDTAQVHDTNGWLTVTSETDATRLVALDASGQPLDTLAAEPALGTAVPLALHEGELLVARPRGSMVSLSTVACDKGTKQAAAPGDPSSGAE